LNEKLDKLNKQFDEDKSKFADQKRLVEKIEWMKKEQKNYLREKKD